jgi:hypothetical protein
MVVIFAFTIFPIVSATILQTFQYDTSLGGGNSYLKADYSIRKEDETHQRYASYAWFCMCVYCIGIPSLSFVSLYSNRTDIETLQRAESRRLR